MFHSNPSARHTHGLKLALGGVLPWVAINRFGPRERRNKARMKWLMAAVTLFNVGAILKSLLL